MIKKLIYSFILCFCFLVNAQEKKPSSYIELNYFYGNIIEHSPELAPIIQAHPSGFLFSWNKKKLDDSKFGHAFNFPDFGFSASYHDFKTETLGEVFAAYAHYNFYLLNRNSKHQLKLSSGFGLGYATSPFDKVDNSKNWAIGSTFVASAFLKLSYDHQYLIDNFGLNAGFSLIHYSNGSFKAPNLGVNTVAANIGINYNFDEYQSAPEKNIIKEEINDKFKFNLALRAGINESLVNGSGLHPFVTLSAFTDKKLTYVSTISFGADFFFSTFLKDYIEWNNIQEGVPDETADWKRVGIFAGYEMNMEHFSVLGQIGFKVYYPYEYVSRIYERFGFRKRFNEHLYADLTLKINMFRAEGLEFGIGYRF